MPYYGDPQDLDTYNDRFADEDEERRQDELHGDPETNIRVRNAFHRQVSGRRDSALDIYFEADAWWAQDNAREELWEAHADGDGYRFVLVN